MNKYIDVYARGTILVSKNCNDEKREVIAYDPDTDRYTVRNNLNGKSYGKPYTLRRQYTHDNYMLNTLVTTKETKEEHLLKLIDQYKAARDKLEVAKTATAEAVDAEDYAYEQAQKAERAYSNYTRKLLEGK